MIMFADHYAALLAAQRPPVSGQEAFDNHVLACAIAKGCDEVNERGGHLSAVLGLTGHEIGDLLSRYFPALSADSLPFSSSDGVARSDEELMVHELLMRHMVTITPYGRWVASIIARRSMEPDHLWQALGLFERSELRRLLESSFRPLAEKNITNMRWKRFFYREVCESEGFSMCTVPDCRACVSFAECFSDESGESAMARARRAVGVIELIPQPELAFA